MDANTPSYIRFVEDGANVIAEVTDQRALALAAAKAAIRKGNASIPRPEPDSEPTELYRHFDADGSLLYVGISLSALYRLKEHKTRSAWFGKIANITIERFPSRRAALDAEASAIRTEKTVHNRPHTSQAADLRRGRPRSIPKKRCVPFTPYLSKGEGR